MEESEKKQPEGDASGFTPPSSEDLRQLSLAMTDLSASLHEFVVYMRENPEIGQIPDSVRELTKRISVLATRL